MSIFENSPLITPFLWFDANAEEAVDFYLGVFPNSRKLGEFRVPGGGQLPEGMILTISFELDGHRFTALNGGPDHAFNDAVSFVVCCHTQAEIDRYWSALLADGGSEIACGWLKDRFGLRWQVAPARIAEWIQHPAGFQAMSQMKKLDIAAFERAVAS